jgi:hypothetical protein
MLLYLHDVSQISMLIQFASLKLEFEEVVMGIGEIFRSPIPADKIMTGNEIAANCQCVHGPSRMARDQI